MAKTETEKPSYSATAVEPPPMRRGAGRNSYPLDFLNEVVELLANGQAASDGVLYDGGGDRDKAKQQANTAAMKLRKAVIHHTGVDDPKTYKQRTWEDPDAPGSFRIAVVNNSTEKDD